MVKNTGKAPGAGGIRPLNLPVPVIVKEDEGSRPVSIILRRRKLEVASIDDVWDIEDEWWRPVRVHRLYYRITTIDGDSLTVFRDLCDTHTGRSAKRYVEGWYCSY